MRDPRGRLIPGFATVRVRTTLFAVAVVGVALVVASVGLVVALRQSLLEDMRAAAALRAAEIAASLEAGEAPALAVPEADEQLVQVIGPDGQVVASSSNVDGWRPVADLEPGSSATLTLGLFDDADDEPEEFVVVASVADTATGPLRIVVARTIEDVAESTSTLAGLLAAGVPVLALVVGVVTWIVVGRALSPVESIRNEVDRISSSELHRRVPEPSSGDEIARLASTMNEMLERLQQAQQRQRRFVNDASHELRSPIASIRQHAEVAAVHPNRTDIAELAGTVLAESRRMQGLVDQLLILAHGDEAQTMPRRPVDLDDIVFDEARHLRHTTTHRIDTSGVSAGRISGDPQELQRIVRNLGDNAARHATSVVALALQDGAGAVVLTVDDDGPGIPPGERERVFERFVRLDDARARDTGGAGLGLAIVADIVAAHGGTVLATQSPLGGARFRVELPVG